MIGNIVYLNNNLAHIKINTGTPISSNLMNLHIIFEDDKKKILGEIEDIDPEIIKVRFLGEIVNNKFYSGVIRKPNLSANVRIITKEEFGMIVGEDKMGTMEVGVSPLYDDCPIRLDINDLFSNHMAVFGNTGSGKSWGVATLLQSVFTHSNIVPFRSNFFIFDAYGEYHTAFQEISKVNPNLSFKYYTTNFNDPNGQKLILPLWLFNVDDLALLLGASNHAQLPIIEKLLRMVRVFAESDDKARAYKNHLIAKAIISVMFTNQTSNSKRNDIFAILESCSTPELNIEAPVQGIGYTRKLRECYEVDNKGEFAESVLITNYVSSFLNEELENYEPSTTNPYNLLDLEKALNFTLISEGLLHNQAAYDNAISLKVKLHSLVIGPFAKHFDYPNYVTVENYVASLVSSNGKKAQIVNFNLEDIDDFLAKVMVKVYARILFEFCKKLPNRASIPFNIFLEEAHRYVQNDNDTYLLGYNIFERIAKEGRKYGILFNLISQRPVDISETVISQCSNFIIFKMNHPRDVEYMRQMLPNISNEIVEKAKSLQSGTCVGFGKAFKIPMILKMNEPNPVPSSSSCNVFEIWKA